MFCPTMMIGNSTSSRYVERNSVIIRLKPNVAKKKCQWMTPMLARQEGTTVRQAMVKSHAHVMVPTLRVTQTAARLLNRW